MVAPTSTVLQRPIAAQKQPDPVLRERVGEFVGNVFYGTLLKELQNSNLKSDLMHGGRGEEVFRGMLNMELARRMGQSPGDPIANRIHQALVRKHAGESSNSTARWS